MSDIKEILKEAADARYDEMISALKECIAIPSVYDTPKEGCPYGEDVRRCLDFVLEKAEGLGFKVKNVGGRVGWCEYGEGAEMIAAAAHLDVVPVGDGWTKPPFGGVIEDGRIYGRGAIDDKGPAMAALYALAAIKDSGLPIKRRIRLIFGTDEERGSSDIRYYKEHKEEMPVMGFTPDGCFPLINGEKGIINVCMSRKFSQDGDFRLVSIEGGTAANVVPASAAARIECPENRAEELSDLNFEGVELEAADNGLILKAKGKEAHGSTPEKGVNAIGLLIKALAALPFSAGLKEIFKFLDEKIGLETNGESLSINISDEISGNLTLNLGVIKGGEDSVSLTINYRYPVTKTYGDCGPKLNGTFQRAGFSCIEQLHENSLYISKENVLVAKLLNVYREQTGTSAEPICIGGGTYAKSFDNFAAFGPTFPGDPDVEHKPDEYVLLDTLKKDLRMFAHALYSLSV